MNATKVYSKKLSKLSKPSNSKAYQPFSGGQFAKIKVSNEKTVQKYQLKTLPFWTLGHFVHFAKTEVSNPKSVGTPQHWTLWTLKKGIPRKGEVHT